MLGANSERSKKINFRLSRQVGRMSDLTIPTASFADFCQNFGGRIIEDGSGDPHPDVHGATNNFFFGS